MRDERGIKQKKKHLLSTRKKLSKLKSAIKIRNEIIDTKIMNTIISKKNKT